MVEIWQHYTQVHVFQHQKIYERKTEIQYNYACYAGNLVLGIFPQSCTSLLPLKRMHTIYPAYRPSVSSSRLSRRPPTYDATKNDVTRRMRALEVCFSEQIVYRKWQPGHRGWRGEARKKSLRSFVYKIIFSFLLINIWLNIAYLYLLNVIVMVLSLSLIHI